MKYHACVGYMVVPCFLLLGGCITASGLNDEIQDLTTAADATVMTPCRSPDAASLAWSPIMSSAPAAGETSDLELGLALIAAGTSQETTGRLQTLAARAEVRQLVAELRAAGIDLAQLKGADFVVDDAGADLAEQTLSAPAITSLMAEGGAKAARPQTVDIRRSEWKAFSRDVALTTAENGWTASFARSLGRFLTTGSALALRKDQATARDLHAQQDLRRKFLVTEYMIAYFRNGEVFALGLNYDELQKKLADKLKESITDPKVLVAAQAEMDKFAAEFQKTLCSKDETGPCIVLGAIGEQTFVTRAGKSYGFPGITATFDLVANKKVSTNKIKAEEVIPDLVRVVVEGLGDGVSEVPGEKNSTLCKVLPERCGLETQAAALKTTNNIGDRVEAGSTALIGAAIRGGWLISLNNEVVATSVTTGASVSLRKISEAAAWSYTKCDTAKLDPRAPAYRRISIGIRN